MLQFIQLFVVSGKMFSLISEIRYLKKSKSINFVIIKNKDILTDNS